MNFEVTRDSLRFYKTILVKKMKIKPLETNRQVFTWLCVCSPDEMTSKRKKNAYIIFTTIVLITISAMIAASVACFLRNVSIDLERSLYCVGQTMPYSNLYLLIVGLFLRHKIDAIFGQLNEIYDKYQNTDLIQFVEQANDKSEWIWKIYFKFVLCGFFIGTIITTVASLAYCWILNGHFDTNYVYHSHYIILPWDQKNLIEYIVTAFFELISAEFYLLLNGCFLVLLISMCLHHQAFYEQFQYSVRKLETPDENRNDKEYICEMIRFHMLVKNWFLDTAQVYSEIILIVLIFSMMFMACVVFQLDLLIEHPNFNLFVILISVIMGDSTLFMYCFFGKLATESYFKMGDCLYEANWQALPIELQKHFIVMIRNTQKPLYYHGFGIAVLNLETFCTLTRAIFSYYMLFKTLTLQ